MLVFFLGLVHLPLSRSGLLWINLVLPFSSSLASWEFSGSWKEGRIYQNNWFMLFQLFLWQIGHSGFRPWALTSRLSLWNFRFCLAMLLLFFGTPVWAINQRFPTKTVELEVLTAETANQGFDSCRSTENVFKEFAERVESSNNSFGAQQYPYRVLRSRTRFSVFSRLVQAFLDEDSSQVSLVVTPWRLL